MLERIVDGLLQPVDLVVLSRFADMGPQQQSGTAGMREAGA
ncbi:hypothetical protein ACFS07_17345 [Undibacterium arcticum]